MDTVLQFLSALLEADVWPLTGLLIALLILKQVKDDVRPIFLALVGPLQKQAQSNAVAWAVGIMLGVLSSLGALTEVAAAQHWVYVGIICKVIGPGLATIVALIKQSPVPPDLKPAPTGTTTPPFSATPPPAAQ